MHFLATLDVIQKQAIKLIGDPALSNTLDFLAYRRTVSALCLYYRYYHGISSDELRLIISPISSKKHAVFESPALHRCPIGYRTNALAKSFIPMTGGRFLSPSFPASYKLHNFSCFKTDIHRQLRLLYRAHKISSSFSFPDGGANPGHQGLHFSKKVQPLMAWQFLFALISFKKA